MLIINIKEQTTISAKLLGLTMVGMPACPRKHAKALAACLGLGCLPMGAAMAKAMATCTQACLGLGCLPMGAALALAACPWGLPWPWLLAHGGMPWPWLPAHGGCLGCCMPWPWQHARVHATQLINTIIKQKQLKKLRKKGREKDC